MGNLINLLCKAIEEKKCVELSYDEHIRIVEVHIVGRNKKGDLQMKCYQVSGGSESGNNTDWKTMDLKKISNAKIIDQTSNAPRPDYNPIDPIFDENSISCSVQVEDQK